MLGGLVCSLLIVGAASGTGVLISCGRENLIHPDSVYSLFFRWLDGQQNIGLSLQYPLYVGGTDFTLSGTIGKLSTHQAGYPHIWAGYPQNGRTNLLHWPIQCEAGDRLSY